MLEASEEDHVVVWRISDKPEVPGRVTRSRGSTTPASSETIDLSDYDPDVEKILRSKFINVYKEKNASESALLGAYLIRWKILDAHAITATNLQEAIDKIPESNECQRNALKDSLQAAFDDAFAGAASEAESSGTEPDNDELDGFDTEVVSQIEQLVAVATKVAEKLTSLDDRLKKTNQTVTEREAFANEQHKKFVNLEASVTDLQNTTKNLQAGYREISKKISAPARGRPSTQTSKRLAAAGERISATLNQL
ncbi:hypothetical protein CYMTET_35631 [Cymbomonas tetramitiformis]|uniref:Uncharacterized protein n=1 Tax=Cymbomonas tetramitiformis TaxID=36881 RepID=A0AAE0F8R8_9CHLO|nr:hypothetical protein CYMTET_35631 [Cymbomonas tetramitiformis]